MNCKGPESEAQSGGSDSTSQVWWDEYCLLSTALGKAACLVKFYWFSFAVVSSQLALSIFIFWMSFYEPRCAEEQIPNQTPFWCGCWVITSDVWQLTDAQRVTYECWREETCSQIICQFCSCVLGRGALLQEMAQTLALSVKAAWWEYCGGADFCLCIKYAHLHWDVTVNFQRQAVHNLPPAFQLNIFYCCMHLI